MSERRREIAVMRALGARRQTVFSIVLAESILLCFAGGLLGLLLGHGLVFLAAPIVEERSGILIDPFAFEPIELVLLPVLIVLASIVGFVPGMTAYRTDVAKALAD
jgi:putative ABC transport system permease protein